MVQSETCNGIQERWEGVCFLIQSMAIASLLSLRDRRIDFLLVVIVWE